ncbi:MAG: single-stranded DNA-binding protein [Treponema sp.]|jgi:single-strand DNA-binding protein|nr:single-stranded DNA-binding protein [Treponema sp.]
MADLNHVVLIGRLTRDSELRYTPNGTAICNFSIAVNRRKKDGDSWSDEPSFFNIVLWGRQGESLSQYLLKGKQVGIEGELRQERWQQDGQNRSKIEIVADNVQLLGGGNSGNSDGGGSRGGYDNSRNSSGNAGKNGGGYSRRTGGNETQHRTQDNEDGFTDDIPF